MSGPPLPSPPRDLLDGRSLFLDLDGTLFDLVDCPEDVVADAPLRALLDRLVDRLDGRIAVVSGRSLDQIDAMLGPVAARMAVSGSHGSEHRWQGVHAHPARPAALEAVAERFRAFADQHEGVLVEEKSFGVVLHYRRAPEQGAAAHELAGALARRHDLYPQEGKMMIELRLPGGDKGTAVRRLMSRPLMAGTTPVFMGDDQTDEPGFAVAREMGGAAILVGERAPTAADHALPSPAAVREWLMGVAR